MGIITEISAWFIILCIFAGLAFATILYYRQKPVGLSSAWIKVMAAFRFVSITIITFLLLSPLVRISSRTIEKPVIIIAQDNSASVTAVKDSAWYKTNYLEALSNLKNELSGDYEVRTYTFGEEISDKKEILFSEKQTDISALFKELSSRYANRNVGALIMATDGIFNQGEDPLYASGKPSYPVYTIAMGDTNVRKDLIVSKVNYNRITYLGNTFPVEVVVTANRYKGKNVCLAITRNGSLLTSSVISIGTDRYSEAQTFNFTADKSGMQHLRISLSPLEDEASFQNNSEDIFIEVLDAREKILILYSAPHPDVSALKQSIESNSNYEVETVSQADFNKPLNAYNLVILHQIPSKGYSIPSYITGMKPDGPSFLFIIGGTSDLNLYNSLKTGISVVQSVNKTDEALPLASTDFSLFTTSENVRRMITVCPPLSVPYAEYKTTTAVNVLLYQKIGNVPTRKPLVAFSNFGTVRSGTVCGEGLWKWRLYNYMNTGNHDAFDETLDKMIQYLSVKTDRGQFRVDVHNNFGTNENVEFTAEVYNDAFEAVNTPDVSMDITDSAGKKYSYMFSKTAGAYSLNAGIFPPGEYAWRAAVKLGSKTMVKSGRFIVTFVNIEFLNLLADHSLLYTLATRNRGEMIYPADLSALAEKIKARDDIKAVSYSHKSLNVLVNLFWVLLFIIGLLGAEWFFRKRNGMY